MSLNKASLWLGTLVVLAGCPEPEEKTKLDAVTVSCKPTALEVGQTSQCTASSQPTIADLRFDWKSSAPDVATVDAMGKVTTSRGGTTTITASATQDGITKEAQVTLTITTVHANAITTNETWRAAENPHLVRGALDVTGALTIEAGVELSFEQDSGLRVTTGTLRALGTQQASIRMVAKSSTPTKGYWRGVVLAAAGGASELNHVTLSHCGAASGKGACLALENQAVPVLRHVTVRDSGTAGVVVADDGSAFGTESTTLHVSRSEGYAVRIGANQAGTLPAQSTFTDNTLQAIELRGDVTRTQTWPNFSIPYVVNSSVLVGDDSTSPTLTLPAGTVLRFGSGVLFVVHGGNNPAGLIVEGTESAPVLFTADAASPQPGHWSGVILRSQITSNIISITHATIEYGGLDIYDERVGNLTVGEGARPVVKNVLVRKGLTYGAFLQSSTGVTGGEFSPDSTALSAHDNGGYAIGVMANQAGTLPKGGTFRDNTRNAVEIRDGHVVATQTWPDLGIPYVINYFMNVGSASARPTLTLLPGTELRFGPQGGLSVGAEGRPGTLVAYGIFGEKYVRFVPDTLTPTRGFWRGLHFWDATGSNLDYALVTHAGAGGPSPSIGTGNVNLYRKLEFVANNDLNDSSGCGITVSDGTRAGTENVTTNYTLFNNFSNNAGGDQCKN